jgi:hypothetical protein
MGLNWIDRTVSMTGAFPKLLMVGTVSATVTPYLGRMDMAKFSDLHGERKTNLTRSRDWLNTHSEWSKHGQSKASLFRSQLRWCYHSPLFQGVPWLGPQLNTSNNHRFIYGVRLSIFPPSHKEPEDSFFDCAHRGTTVSSWGLCEHGRRNLRL